MTFKKGHIPFNKLGLSKKELERRHTVNKTKSGWFRRYNRSLRKQVFIKLGDKCAICGFADPRALQIDHVFNDGYKERWEMRSQSQRMRKVLKDNSGRYQILCANCNFIKKYEEEMKKWGEVPSGQ